MSNINEEQISMVKKEVAGQAKEPAGRPEAPKTEGEKGSGAAQGEAPKKKIAAVFRPQNSQQMRNMRPARPQGSRPAGHGNFFCFRSARPLSLLKGYPSKAV